METREHHDAWNKGKSVGLKALVKPEEIWAIRIHPQNTHAVRDLAMFICLHRRTCRLKSTQPRSQRSPAGHLT